MFLSVILLCAINSSHPASPSSCYVIQNQKLFTTTEECYKSIDDVYHSKLFEKFSHVNGKKVFDMKDYQCIQLNGERV